LLQARVARASFDSMGCLHSGQWSGLFGDVTEHHRLLHGARRVTSCRCSRIAMQPETLARGSRHGTRRQRLADKITSPSNSPICETPSQNQTERRIYEFNCYQSCFQQVRPPCLLVSGERRRAILQHSVRRFRAARNNASARGELRLQSRRLRYGCVNGLNPYLWSSSRRQVAIGGDLPLPFLRHYQRG
jgi:hypothetical protein